MEEDEPPPVLVGGGAPGGGGWLGAAPGGGAPRLLVDEVEGACRPGAAVGGFGATVGGV